MRKQLLWENVFFLLILGLALISNLGVTLTVMGLVTMFSFLMFYTSVKRKREGAALFVAALLIAKMWALFFICPLPRRIPFLVALAISVVSAGAITVYFCYLLMRKQRERWNQT